mmetsp:Transcript_3695/g.7442  ORF Transcript_3695/g.7442 Transcript_3695/m.7442 type:complete len:202 (-) Transcript_3695:124-729(-)
MGDEDRLCLAVRRDVTERLEVLSDEQQLGHLLRGERFVGAAGDGVSQAINDCPPLPRDALTLELRGIRRSLSCLHDLDLLGLRRHNRGVSQALLLVDLIHGVHDLSIRCQLCDEGLVDRKAKGTHLKCQLVLDCIGDVVFLLEGLIEQHRRHLRPDDVRDIGVDLLVHVCQLVHSLLNFLRHDRLLNRHLGSDKDVVLRLR